MTRRTALARIVGAAFAPLLVLNGERSIGCVGGPLNGITIKDGDGDKFGVVVWFSETMTEEFDDLAPFRGIDPSLMFARSIYRRGSDGYMHYDEQESSLPESLWCMAASFDSLKG